MRSLAPALLVVGCLPCLLGVPAEPRVRCTDQAFRGTASLCVKAVAPRLGARDQVEAYDPIARVRVLLRPASSGAPSQTGAAANGQPDTPAEIEEEAFARAPSTDAKGDLVVTAAPGAYRVCAVAESSAAPSRRVTSCAPATLVNEHPTKLLILHEPFGDFLRFSWQD